MPRQLFPSESPSTRMLPRPSAGKSYFERVNKMRTAIVTGLLSANHVNGRRLMGVLLAGSLAVFASLWFGERPARMFGFENNIAIGPESGGTGTLRGSVSSFPFALATVSGKVTTGNGNPIAGAVITLTDSSTLATFSSAATNSSGNYTISNVPTGANYDPSADSFNIQVYGQPLSVLTPLTGNVSGLNFAKSSQQYTASGNIIINGGGDLTGVTVTPLAPGGPFTSPTPCPLPYTGGHFDCFGLWVDTNYDIIPAKPNYTFTPAPVRVSDNVTTLQYTGNPLATVATASATSIGQTAATLNGNVNPNGIATNGWFEWGTDATLNTNTATVQQAKGTGTTSQPLTQALSTLTGGTVYYFRAVASNAAGTVRGSIATFTTTAAARVLTVASTNPSSGVSITVSPNDNGAQGNGTTQFTRTYNNSTVVSLTAPATASGNNFQKWQRDGVDFAVTQATTVTMDANHTLTAVYRTPPGVVQFGLANYSQGEASGPASISVTRTGGGGGAASVQFATVAGGNATGGASCGAGVDYVNAAGTLNWADGDSSNKTFALTLCNDSVFEGNETVRLSLSNASGATLGAQTTATLTITDDETQPAISINDLSLSEGNSGTTNFDFTVSLSNPSTQTVTVNYATADGTGAVANNDYQALSPTLLTFNPGDTSKNVRVLVNGDNVVEPNETFFVNLTNATNATIARAQGTGNILNDDAVGLLQFSASNYNVGEGGVAATVTVTRSGDTSGAATVDFLSSDGTATQSQDYTIASGTLSFAATETSKTFNVLIIDDVFVESNKTLNVTLTNPTGATLATPSTATVTISDNDVSPPTTNPLDNADERFFVRQHYYDFLSRLPDQSGFDFWVGQITQCGTNQTCIATKRLDVSNAFFYELEYQQTAAYDFRLYRAAFGNNQPFPNPDATNPAVTPSLQAEAKKLPNYTVFSSDRARLIGLSRAQHFSRNIRPAWTGRPSWMPY
jgi:hypothetical protein